MGIPGLMQRMEALASRQVLSKTQDGQSRDAIIDGPSLCYHIYYLCLSSKSRPTYANLGQTAVAWLAELETYGFKIQAIFFDGLLPLSKNDVRLSRQQSYADALIVYHKSNDVVQQPQPRAGLQWSHLFIPTNGSNSKGRLPAAPFLVPATIEALLKSKYASRTSVVPGEADSFCAERARKQASSRACTIFSSDSDLIIHDLGPEGRVIQFRDIEAAHIAGKGAVIKILEYWPADIARRHGLPNLITAGYHMQDRHRTFKACVECARASHDNGDLPGYADFVRTYSSFEQLSVFASSTICKAAKMRDVLAKLDPRISEAVHRTSPGSTTNKGDAVDMYLPVLIDDDTKASGWQVGASIRHLAYSLLLDLGGGALRVHEYSRRGTKIVPTTLESLHTAEARSIVSQLINAVQPRSSGDSTISPADSWRLLGLQLMLQTLLEADKQLPPLKLVVALLSRSAKPEGWSFIHLAAQLEAALYSLRILKQLLEVVIECQQVTGPNHDSLPDMIELQSLLTLMPGLAELFDPVAGERAQAEAEKLHFAASEMIASMQIERQELNSEDSTPRTKKKQKRKRKASESDNTSVPKSRMPHNLFELLSE